MNWNNGYERKCLEKKLKKQREEYKRLGMTDAQIAEIEAIDREIFRSDRRYYSHTQPLEIENDDFDYDDCNPLFKHFVRNFSEYFHPDYSNPYWWIDEIEDSNLYNCAKKFSECEKDIITLLVFNDCSQSYIAHNIFHVSDKTISVKVKRIRTKLRPFLVKGGEL